MQRHFFRKLINSHMLIFVVMVAEAACSRKPRAPVAAAASQYEWRGRLSAEEYVALDAGLRRAYQGRLLTPFCYSSGFVCLLCLVPALGEKCCCRGALLGDSPPRPPACPASSRPWRATVAHRLLIVPPPAALPPQTARCEVTSAR